MEREAAKWITATGDDVVEQLDVASCCDVVEDFYRVVEAALTPAVVCQPGASFGPVDVRAINVDAIVQ